MEQTAKESVAEFANRFTQTQFELEKLVPNIHRFPESKDSKDICNELELIHAFVIKLKPSISKDLVSRAFKYISLQSLIEAAQCFEDHKAPVQDKLFATNWAPDVLYSSGYGPTNNMKGTNPNHQGRWGCKSRNHSQNKSTGRPQAHITAFDNKLFDGPNSQAQGAGPPTLTNHPGFQEMFDQ